MFSRQSLTSYPECVAYLPLSDFLSTVERGNHVCYLSLLWPPAARFVLQTSAVVCFRDGREATHDEVMRQQRLGSFLIKGWITVVSVRWTEMLVLDALSTEPFKALDNISFVCRNDSISFPREESLRTCRASSTGLNYWSELHSEQVETRQLTSRLVTISHSSLMSSRIATYQKST